MAYSVNMNPHAVSQRAGRAMSYADQAMEETEKLEAIANESLPLLWKGADATAYFRQFQECVKVSRSISQHLARMTAVLGICAEAYNKAETEALYASSKVVE